MQAMLSDGQRVLAEHFLATHQLNLQESVGISGFHNDLCIPKRLEQWNSLQISHNMIESGGTFSGLISLLP